MNRKGGFIRWSRYQYLKLLRINDSPERVAGGLAFGVALGILPTFGLGILIALFAAGPLKVNRASAVLGSLVMNPWTAPFFWGISYMAGSLLLGRELSETMEVIRGLKEGSDMWAGLVGRGLVLPYVLGNAVVAASGSAFFYVACLYSVRAYRRAKARRRSRKTRMDY